ncbi:uncharacterized protein LOC130051556 [Ostrea edulis]|uniref:uncharacterized protein LOC130051556 n=1 Tax=Ostrea edulis TaxID=37623 RepID=UPI0024AE8F06|nr:uncharacterized protein LOC130051556 [Ostrea edulis]
MEGCTEAYLEIPGPNGDQNVNYGNFDVENRFKAISESETTEFIQSKRNKNTSRKTEGHMKVLYDWLVNICDENRRLHEIPAKELNMYLARFFLSVRKPDGGEYEPDTLRGYLGSFSRYLRDNSYEHNIVESHLFSHAREVLMSKRKDLKSQGLGNKKRKAEPISFEDFQRLLDTKQIGNGDSMCPINLYKEYRRHRPSEMLDPGSRFYLSIKQKPTDEVWYKKQPMGKNSLGKLVSNMTNTVGIMNKRLTNHGIRKTTVTNLLEAGFEPTEVMQITGHKNVQSINNYSHLPFKKQKEMSTVLSNVTNVTSTSATFPHEEQLDDGCDEFLSQAVQLIETSTASGPQEGLSIIDLPITVTSNGIQLQHPGFSMFQNANISGNITINVNPLKE